MVKFLVGGSGNPPESVGGFPRKNLFLRISIFGVVGWRSVLSGEALLLWWGEVFEGSVRILSLR